MFDFSMLSMITMSIRYGSLLLVLRLQNVLQNPSKAMQNTAGLMARLKQSFNKLSPIGLSLCVSAFFYTPAVSLASLLSTYTMISLGAGLVYGATTLLAFTLACLQEKDSSVTLGADLFQFAVNIVEFCATSGLIMLMLYGVGQLLMTYSSWQLTTVLSVTYIGTFAVLLLTEFLISPPAIINRYLPESAKNIANNATQGLIALAVNPREAPQEKEGLAKN